MDKETIGKELQKFGLADVAIAKLSADYMPLIIKGLDDKKGLEKVHDARMDVVKRRTSIEKTRKELKEESLVFGRAVDGEAKRLTGLLEPIESHLTAEEKKVTDELARIKAEAEAKEAARIQKRVDRLFDLGSRFDGQNYSVMGLMIPAPLVKVATDDQFNGFCKQIEAKIADENARIAEEEAKYKAELEHLARIQAEQEAEQKRLYELAQKQIDDMARMKAEQEEREAKIRADQEARERQIRLDQEAIEREQRRIADAESNRKAAALAEQQRIEDNKRRVEELEIAKKEAAEKARIESEERIKREAEEKIEKERLAKIAAEKKAARRPDKGKILSWLDAMSAVIRPVMKTSEGSDLFGEILGDMTVFINDSRKKVEAL